MTLTTRRVLLIALAAFLLLGGALTIRISSGPTAEEMKHQIEATLPLGSSTDKVINFVIKQGMTHSDYLPRERIINARLYGVKKGLLYEESLYVQFRFDSTGALQSFSVEEVATSI